MPALSSDATRIMINRRDLQTGNMDLWLYDLARATSSPFTFDPSDDTAAVFSPKGERVVFWAERAESPGIYQKPTNGSSRASRDASR